METEEKFRKVLDSFKNNTKLSIIFLLAENESMTVTQMSEHIDVSRSNLYHFVSQLVEDGILNKPEIIPKKNYVEKYYTLNAELFGAVQWDELESHFASMSNEEVRELLRGFLIGQAFNLQMLAERVRVASDGQIEKFKEAMLKQDAFMAYSISQVGDHPDFHDILKRIMEEMEKVNPEKSKKKDELVRSLILVLPYL